MSLTGPTPAPASTLTDASGNYSLRGLIYGSGTYTVTPTKAALPPGSAGINTVDVIAIQKHFLLSELPSPDAGWQAADVNGVGGVNTVDVIAVQRFFLGLINRDSPMLESTSSLPRAARIHRSIPTSPIRITTR